MANRNDQAYPTETMIILSLKKRDGKTLSEISNELGISKMAVLKHIQVLESRGILERRIFKKKVGRPVYKFYIATSSNEFLGDSSAQLLNLLLDFLVNSGHREEVINFLKSRYKEVEEYYLKSLSNYKGEKRVEQLSKLRYLESYFPELKKLNDSTYELLEFNCPIYKISSKFGEACELESKLFSNVLKMNVKSSHTQINGYGTCRFIIKNKKN